MRGDFTLLKFYPGNIYNRSLRPENLGSKSVQIAEKNKTPTNTRDSRRLKA